MSLLYLQRQNLGSLRPERKRYEVCDSGQWWMNGCKKVEPTPSPHVTRRYKDMEAFLI